MLSQPAHTLQHSGIVAKVASGALLPIQLRMAAPARPSPVVAACGDNVLLSLLVAVVVTYFVNRCAVGYGSGERQGEDRTLPPGVTAKSCDYDS